MTTSYTEVELHTGSDGKTYTRMSDGVYMVWTPFPTTDDGAWFPISKFKVPYNVRVAAGERHLSQR